MVINLVMCTKFQYDLCDIQRVMALEGISLKDGHQATVTQGMADPEIGEVWPFRPWYSGLSHSQAHSDCIFIADVQVR